MAAQPNEVDPFAAGLRWRPFPIPGSDRPVALLRLDVDRTEGSSTSLVRFPPGWARPGPGHYACGEEFVVLEGELLVSGERYARGDRAWLPPGTPRTGSVSGPGALALAWFSGEPRWVEGREDRSAEPAARTGLGSVPIPPAGLRLRGAPGLPGGETRLYPTAPARFDRPARLLWLEPARWSAHAPGEPLPRRPGRVLAHLLGG